jgi:Na+-driven multidrug efflux pump
MLRALSSSTTVLGIMFINEFAFQAMGKAKESLILSISRQGFVFIPFLFISNYLAGLNGIIWSQPLADIVCLFLSLAILKKILNSDNKLNAEVVPQMA